MSYDLEVWSVYPFDPSALRDPEQWEHLAETQWVRSAATWQVSIFGSSRLLPEDVPEEIAQLLPGITYLTEIVLEGQRTKVATQLLQSTSNQIGKVLHGVVFDKQEDTLRTPTGVKRFVPPSKQETFSVLRFSWWFLESPLLTSEGCQRFLALLERFIPEALPKRYGLYEPPQHIYAETGKAHLLRFMEENVHDFVVWYPHRPVTSLYLGHPEPVGASKLGFRTNQLSIEVESAVLTQPGWANSLRQFWREVSRFIKPVYGEVRTLGGRQRRGATVFASFKDEAGLELTKGWWWRGIPKQLGCAVVLGETYQKLWPAFMSKALLEEQLAFASTSDWAAARDLSENVGTPPGPVSMRREAQRPGDQEYPEAWPFGEPFDPPKPSPRPSLLRKFRGLFNSLIFAVAFLFANDAYPQEAKSQAMLLCALCVVPSASSFSLPASQQTETPDWCKPLPRPEYKSLERVAISDPWFEVYKVAPDTFAIYEPHQAEEVISYLILGKEKALLFDTGMGISDIRKLVSGLTALPVIVLNSHTHNDHVGGNWQFDTIYSMDTDFSRQNAKGSTADAQDELAPGQICGELPKGFDAKAYRTKTWDITKYVHDGDKLDLGSRTLEIISTPGHTPDAICLFDLAGGLLFTGDTYYPAAIWLYRPETDFDAYAKSVARLAALAPQVKTVLGAHNIPVAPPSVLTKLPVAFADLRAGKANCKPDSPDKKRCTIREYTFLLAAAP